MLPFGSDRPLALTTPAETLLSNPNGEPIASTHSPTFKSRVPPRCITGRPLAAIQSTATPVFGSEPNTLATNSRRSVSSTVTSLASRTTWALVRIRPSALMMKPEPWPREGWLDAPSSRPCCWPGTPNRQKYPQKGSLDRRRGHRVERRHLAPALGAACPPH